MPDGGLSSPTVATPGCVASPPTAPSARSRAGARGGTPATTARFDPRSVTVAPGGDVLFSDDDRHRIWRLTPDGRIFTVAGSELNYSGYADQLDASGSSRDCCAPKGRRAARNRAC
jgi:hypothetical protein